MNLFLLPVGGLACYYLCPTTLHVNDLLQFACKAFLEEVCADLLSLFLIEEEAKPLDARSPLQPLNGELLPLRAMLRPLRLLPLSLVQHHLQLLENELPVLQEDIERDAHIHMHQLMYAADF